MTTPLPLLATTEQTVAAWIASIPGIIALGGMQAVGTTLPADANPDGTPAAWTQTGYVTVSVVGGSPDIYLPVKKPVIQVDTWATVPGSNLPPWQMANVLMETIRYATLQRKGFNRVLALSAGGIGYPSAVVDSAYFLTEPRRSYSDAADYAHFLADVQFVWRTSGDRID